MSKRPLAEWSSVTIAIDQLSADGLGHTGSFTVSADGSWGSFGENRSEHSGTAWASSGLLERWELRLLDRLLDIVNREPIPDATTRVSHRVPEDSHSLVLSNPGETATLFENRDERAEHPGAYVAFDDRADIAEIAAVGLLMNHLGDKYAGEDFLF
ncbi:MAG: hypothetical protein U1E59_05120 [Amaricoccus sp.]